MWQCVCGAINEDIQLKCYSCGATGSVRHDESVRPNNGGHPPLLKSGGALGTTSPLARNDKDTILTTHEEKITTSKINVKQKVRVNIVGLMVVFLIVITFFAIKGIDSIPYHHFTAYVGKCFATWAKSLAYCELVMVIGGFLLYLLREHEKKP